MILIIFDRHTKKPDLATYPGLKKKPDLIFGFTFGLASPLQIFFVFNFISIRVYTSHFFILLMYIQLIHTKNQIKCYLVSLQWMFYWKRYMYMCMLQIWLIDCYAFDPLCTEWKNFAFLIFGMVNMFFLIVCQNLKVKYRFTSELQRLEFFVL